MDLLLLQRFQRHVLSQCEFMLLAANDVNAGLQDNQSRLLDGRPANLQPNMTRIFFGLQNLLNAAANISKALWGQKGRKFNERKTLRDSIGISDTSLLREVDMRNNFEHFDERLDEWWRDSTSHNSIDFSLTNRLQMEGFGQKEWFRAFDPETANIYFWGEVFNMQQLIEEAQKIVPKLQEALHESPPEAASLEPPA